MPPTAAPTANPPPSTLQLDATFLYRVPLAPAALFDTLRRASTLDDTLAVLAGWPLAPEALLVASPTLARECTRPVRRAKTARHLNRSLHRYLSRASTRSVPFGLFAAVGAGVCADTAPLGPPTLQVALTALSGPLRAARPALENALPPELQVMLNPTAVVRSGQVHWQPPGGPARQAPCSAALWAQLAGCRTPQPLRTLRAHLSDDLLRALLGADLLLSELQPHQCAAPAHEARWQALGGPDLEPARQAYHAAPDSPGRVAALRAALGTQGQDGEVQRTLGLDAALTGCTVLPAQVLDELRRGLLALRASPEAAPEPVPWSAFAAALRARAGTGRLPLAEAVALFEALPPAGAPPASWPGWTALLEDSGPVLTLTDGLLRTLPPTAPPWTQPFDLLAWVLAPGRAALDRGEYTLALLGGSTPDPGQSTARLRAAHPQLPGPSQTAPAGTLLTALCLQHPHAPANDTARCRPEGALELHVPGHPLVPEDRRVNLQELAVGLRHGHPELWCTRRAQPLHLTLPTLTRADHLGEVAQFLAALALYGRTPPRWRWGPLAARPFLPRVVRGCCVLSAAQWRFPERWRGEGELTDDALRRWLEQLQAPALLRVGRLDRQLTVDWHHPAHRDLIRAEWRRGAAGLSEALATPDQAWFTGPGGGLHLFEGVFTVRP
ncbi:lantibiotic dehydratase [Deinococcus aquaedulcis]|uniref:lantibiotic dehydratase n=1 Tax=Deinococcus aquaedulcis TaxID=2840455 RepID=UPI001C8375AD|nr:lantibiotic dehydratase [Deinococcus aquaedulcis]